MSVLKILRFAMESCRSDVSVENSKVCHGIMSL